MFINIRMEWSIYENIIKINNNIPFMIKPGDNVQFQFLMFRLDSPKLDLSNEKYKIESSIIKKNFLLS